MSKIYTVYRFQFDLPGSVPDQILFDMFDSKGAFLNQLVIKLEDSRETISNLDGDEAEEEINSAITDLNKLLIQKNLQDLDIKGLHYEAGSLMVDIFAASCWPQSISDVITAIEEHWAGNDVEEELEDDSEQDRLLCKLKQLNPHDEDAFDLIFTDISFAFSQESVF